MSVVEEINETVAVAALSAVVMLESAIVAGLWLRAARAGAVAPDTL